MNNRIWTLVLFLLPATAAAQQVTNERPGSVEFSLEPSREWLNGTETSTRGTATAQLNLLLKWVYLDAAYSATSVQTQNREVSRKNYQDRFGRTWCGFYNLDGEAAGNNLGDEMYLAGGLHGDLGFANLKVGGVYNRFQQYSDCQAGAPDVDTYGGEVVLFKEFRFGNLFGGDEVSAAATPYGRLDIRQEQLAEQTNTLSYISGGVAAEAKYNWYAGGYTYDRRSGLVLPDIFPRGVYVGADIRLTRDPGGYGYDQGLLLRTVSDVGFFFGENVVAGFRWTKSDPLLDTQFSRWYYGNGNTDDLVRPNMIERGSLFIKMHFGF